MSDETLDTAVTIAAPALVVIVWTLVSWPHRPRRLPTRVAALVAPSSTPGTAAALDGSPRWSHVVAALAAGLLVAPVVGAAAALAVLMIPAWRARHEQLRFATAVVDELPEVVDLFSLAIGAGLNVRLAVEAVAERAPPLSAAVLRDVVARVRAGVRQADALAVVPVALGHVTRPLVDALAAAERYGAPLGAALDRLALEARQDRRRRAETAARRLPVQLLFPLVLCVLPAFALLTVVPVLAGSLGTLHL
jgi:pilus assembly protein TadC